MSAYTGWARDPGSRQAMAHWVHQGLRLCGTPFGPYLEPCDAPPAPERCSKCVKKLEAEGR